MKPLEKMSQEELNLMFVDVSEALMRLYSFKNQKYGNSFNKEHKTYAEAHYNIKRKYARLLVMAREKKLNPKELLPELIDMAIYSIMCIMKFRPPEIGAKGKIHFLANLIRFIDARCV